MITVLFAHRDGVYSQRTDARVCGTDAREYKGPDKVIAHPPCARWGNYAEKNGALLGDDDGCFAHALWCVRTFGGVIEHPERSYAFDWFGIARPFNGVWAMADVGYVTSVDQGNYGHRARKRTWLYAVNTHLPNLDWSEARGSKPVTDMSLKEREATPRLFAELLINIVRGS